MRSPRPPGRPVGPRDEGHERIGVVITTDRGNSGLAREQGRRVNGTRGERGLGRGGARRPASAYSVGVCICLRCRRSLAAARSASLLSCCLSSLSRARGSNNAGMYGTAEAVTASPNLGSLGSLGRLGRHAPCLGLLCSKARAKRTSERESAVAPEAQSRGRRSSFPAVALVLPRKELAGPAVRVGGLGGLGGSGLSARRQTPRRPPGHVCQAARLASSGVSEEVRGHARSARSMGYVEGLR